MRAAPPSPASQVLRALVRFAAQPREGRERFAGRRGRNVYSLNRIPIHTDGPGVWYPLAGSNFESKMLFACP